MSHGGIRPGAVQEVWGGAILGLGIQWCSVRIHSRRRLFIAGKRDLKFSDTVLESTQEEDILEVVNGACVDVKSMFKQCIQLPLYGNYIFERGHWE